MQGHTSKFTERLCRMSCLSKLRKSRLSVHEACRECFATNDQHEREREHLLITLYTVSHERKRLMFTSGKQSMLSGWRGSWRGGFKRCCLSFGYPDAERLAGCPESIPLSAINILPSNNRCSSTSVPTKNLPHLSQF